MPLCKFCTKFNIQTFEEPQPYRGYLLSNVFDSGRSGCEFCGLLLEHLSSSHKSFPVKFYEFTKTAQSSGPYDVFLSTKYFFKRVLDFNPQWVHFKSERKRCFDRECPHPDALHITGLSIHISRWRPTVNRRRLFITSWSFAALKRITVLSTRLYLSADTGWF